MCKIINHGLLGLYFNLGLNWPKVPVIFGQLGLVIGSYAVREYICWPESDFCSLTNSQCLRSQIVWMGGLPIALASLVLVGLLVDDWYGWGPLFARIKGVFKCPEGQVAPAEGDIELQDMNMDHANNNHPTVNMTRISTSCFIPFLSQYLYLLFRFM